MKFPIGDVMDERCQFSDVLIRTFGYSNLLGQTSNTIDVVPIVARAFAGKFSLDVLSYTSNYARGLS